MKSKAWLSVLVVGMALFLAVPWVEAQSGIVRPRRVRPLPEATPEPEETDTITPGPTASNLPPATPEPTPRARPRVTATPVSSATPGVVTSTPRPTPAPTPADAGLVKGDTTRAFSLYQQKQYAAAITEAKRVAAQFPNDPEAWKIIGFSELELKQYPAAISDLQKSLNLKDDAFTFDGLAQAYFFSEQYVKALPLLVKATTRATPKANSNMLFYRGVAEMNTENTADAEKTFNEVVKANPKDTGALYYLGLLAYKKNDVPAAISWLNRVTVNDPNAADAWRLLASAYLRRASTATEATQAETDFLGAVRAGEQLTRLSQDVDDTLLYSQALIGAAQYAKAIPLLEKAALTKKNDGQVLFMLGAAHLRAKNYVKSITAFEQAAKATPNDVNIYRELGYAYEVQKQYAKALGAYQKGATLAPGDAYFQESIARVKPYAK